MERDAGREAAAPGTLKNEGSTARDHLANERTYLAWVRTGLGLLGLGVALEKLAGDGSASAEVGALMLVGYGVILLIYAVVRFDRVNRALAEGRFPVARSGPRLIGALSILLAAAAFAYVLYG